MKKFFTPVLVSLFVLCSASAAYAHKHGDGGKGHHGAHFPSVEGTSEVDGFSSPESVATDGKFLYVSNLGEKLAPSEKDGDGFISKLDLSGKVLELKFLPKDGKLDAPKGMAITGGVLYVADIDVIAGFDLKSGKRVFELDFSAEKTAFLNDLTVKDGKTLFVSATDTNKIFEVDLKAKSYKALDLASDAGPIGPNGLYWDARIKRLFAVGFGANKPNGQAGAIIWKSGKPEFVRIGGKEGFFDGLAPLGKGLLMYSDWVAFEGKQGVLWITDMKSGETSKLDIPGIGGPADFLYIPGKHVIWLPKMTEGKLLRISVKD